MASRSNKKKTPSPKKDVSICLKLSWQNNERIHLGPPVDATKTSLTTLIHLAASVQESDSPVLLVLQALLSHGSIQANFVYMRTAIPINLWETTTLQGIGVENDGGTALLTLNVDIASLSTAPLPRYLPASTERSIVHTEESASLQNSANILPITDTRLAPIPASDIARPQTKVIVPVLRSNNAVMDINPVEVQTQPQKSFSAKECLRLILDSNFDAASKECCITLLKMLHNLMSTTSSDAKGQKFRTINLSNPALSQKVSSKRGGVEFLCAVGFTPKQEGLVSSSSHLVLLPENEKTGVIESAAEDLRNTLINDLGLLDSELPLPPIVPNAQAAPVPVSGGFDIYKGHAFNVAAAAVGANPIGVNPEGGAKEVSRIDLELRRLEAKSAKLLRQSQDLDRGLLALRPGQQLHQPETGSDDTMEGGGGGGTDGALVAARMKKLDEERKKRENGGFTTKAMRDLEKLKQSKVYTFAQLRICFPDGHSLSCRFHPTESIESVKYVVRGALLSHSLSEFDLYVAPPRKVLQDSSTILSEGLVPAARVHVSWKGSSGPSAGSSFIRPELFAGHNTVNVPAFPEGRLLVDTARNDPTSSESSSKRTLDENALLQRMMGGKGAGLSNNSSSKKESDKNELERKAARP